MPYPIKREHYKLKIGSTAECLCLVCTKCKRLLCLGNYELERYKNTHYSTRPIEFMCTYHEL